MKRFIRFVSILAFSGSVISAVAQPASACSADYDIVQPSQDTRLYQNESLGFSLSIPDNYRTIASDSGRIEIVDPATFDFVQCVSRSVQTHGVITWDYAIASISSWPISIRGGDLREILRSEGIRIPVNNALITFENGRELIVIAGRDETSVGPQGEAVFDMYAYFMSPYNVRLVVISGKMGNETFNQILSSIEIE